MDNIIQQLLANFDFTYVAVVNILTYIIIKVIDELNKDKIVGTWIKRLVLLSAIVIVGTIYSLYGEGNIIILINSSILAPVAWSWILKPLCTKAGIDYKQIDKTINYDNRK